MATVPRPKRRVGTNSEYGRFGVKRPDVLDYKVPPFRLWDFKNETWTSDLAAMSELKKTVVSLWTGRLDWHGKPIYSFDVVNLPYSTQESIIDVIYIVLFIKESGVEQMNLMDHPGSYSFVLQNREQLIGSWAGHQTEVVGDCFTMPDNPAVMVANKSITTSKIKDGRVT
jgi:hypothetical protein